MPERTSFELLSNPARSTVCGAEAMTATTRATHVGNPSDWTRDPRRRLGDRGRALAFLFNNYLIFWRDWPGIVALLSSSGWFGRPAAKPLEGDAVALGWFPVAELRGDRGRRRYRDLS